RWVKPAGAVLVEPLTPGASPAAKVIVLPLTVMTSPALTRALASPGVTVPFSSEALVVAALMAAEPVKVPTAPPRVLAEVAGEVPPAAPEYSTFEDAIALV